MGSRSGFTENPKCARKQRYGEQKSVDRAGEMGSCGMKGAGRENVLVEKLCKLYKMGAQRSVRNVQQMCECKDISRKEKEVESGV